jgi:DNA (cytosine-5)-methyltransferase 1
MSTELVIDCFAGGGGASTGIEIALGRSPDYALNHNSVAVAIHRANHPETRHLCQDVWQVHPHHVAMGRPVGLLWASPDCTHFSRAKGAAPRRDAKIRDMAWAVVKWAREVRPRVIIVENVEEFSTWGPLDSAGKVIDSHKGVIFKVWVRTLRRLGYSVQWRALRACDYGAPTIRKRLFFVMRCDGVPVSWPAPTHGPERAQPYRTAAECIDWSIPCPSIFDRKKPLAENSLRRIAAGIKKFILGADRPFLVPVPHQAAFLASYYGPKRQNEARGQALHDPLKTVTTENRFGLVSVFLSKYFGGVVGSPLDQPLGTVTSWDHNALVAVFLSKYYGKGTGQDVWTPLATTTNENKFGFVAAFLTKYYGQGSFGQTATSPLGTVVSKDRFGVVTVTIDDQTYAIADIGLRMLTPRELFRAQGFPDTYKIDIELDGRPVSKTAQVRACGNSVCPPIAAALIRANYEASEQIEEKAI